MKWNSRLARAMAIAATIGSMILTAIAENGWA